MDWRYEVPELRRGGLNRVQHTRADIAGKGINVAIALKNLGLAPLCVGFNFRENGAVLTEKLDALGIARDFVMCEGALRTNIKLYEDCGTMTELNRPGAFVPSEAQEELLEKIAGLRISDTDILVLSGSRPENVGADFYAKIIRAACGKGACGKEKTPGIFLDFEGEALKLALEAAAQCNTEIFAIKPNLYELESTFGPVAAFGPGELRAAPQIAGFCKAHPALQGVKNICVSMGKHGAVLVTRENTYISPALDVPARGVAGAGDAMVAGLVYALAKNLPEADYLPTAMAAAAATVISEGTQMCTREDFEAMHKKALPLVLCV